MTKQTKYIVGQVYEVELGLIALPDDKLTSRFSIGNNFLSVKADIERQGQLIPCGAQLLNEDQLKAFPGKLFMLTEGVHGRLKVAELLKRKLFIQVHEPKSDAGILERAIASNGPRSVMSAMDISVVATRLEAMGFSVEAACKQLSWVAGKGKPLGTQRYWQYKRLQGLPVAIQHMAHIGAIKLDAVLHMTNRKLTEDQYTNIVAQAKDTRARLAHEEWEADQKYTTREKDVVLQAAMKGEEAPEPQYTPKKRVKAENEPLTTDEVKDAMEELGVSPKPDTRPDPNKPATGPMAQDELLTHIALLRQRGGVLIEVANCIQGLVERKLTSQEFCDAMEAMFADGKGKAKVIRRTIAEKLANALDGKILEPVV